MNNTILFILCCWFSLHCFGQQSDFKHHNFKKADSIAQLYKNESLRNLPLLSYKLTYRLKTDAEKFRAIYIWVCSNIKNDYHTATKILKKGKKYRNNRAAFLNLNKNYKPQFIKKLINEKKTVCTGYAFLVKELSSLANIECEIINGYSKVAKFNPKKLFPNHSWNRVKLQNKWYLCDPILASGYFMVDENIFIFDYNDGYFLTDPNLFIKSHYPENKKWTLVNNNHFNFQNFIEAPFIYGETYKHKITPLLPNTIITKVSINENIPFEFTFDTDLDINKLSLLQSNGWKDIETSLNDYNYKEGVLTFNKQFSKKGLYDLHIKIANDIVASYTIEVTL